MVCDCSRPTTRGFTTSVWCEVRNFCVFSSHNTRAPSFSWRPLGALWYHPRRNKSRLFPESSVRFTRDLVRVAGVSARGIFVADQPDSIKNVEPTAAGFDIASLFALTGYFAFALAACNAGRMTNFHIAVVMAIIIIRLPIIFCTRKFSLSIPLLIVFYAIPLAFFWEVLTDNTNRMMQYGGYSSFAIFISTYLLIPALVFLVDLRQEYPTASHRLLRLVVDAIVIGVWAAVCGPIFLPR